MHHNYLGVAAAAAVGGPLAGGALTAPSQVIEPPALTFETAAISLRNPLPGGGPVWLAMETTFLKSSVSRPRDDRFIRLDGRLQSLIQAAYDVIGFQVVGGPARVRSDLYAIEATTAGNPTPGQVRGMLQSLLAGRFGLVLLRETRRLPVYELVVADGGLKIAAMRPGDCIPPGEVRWDSIDLDAPLYVCGGGRRRVLSRSPETRPRPRWPRITRIEAGGISMPALIDRILGDVDRLVIDRIGFTAPFNVVLDFAPGPESGGPAFSGPTIFTSLEEQLGLRLVPAEAPVEVLAIERVERPSGN